MNKSQDQLVLDHLESGKAISTFLAIKMWRHTRLSRSINTLRNAGHTIYGKMEEHAGKRYKVYFMEDSRQFEVYGKSY